MIARVDLFFLKKLELILAWLTRAVLKNSPSPSEPRLCSCSLQLAAFQFRFQSQSLFCSEGTAGFPGGKQRGRNRDWLGELDPLALPIWNIHLRIGHRSILLLLVHACVAGSQFVPSCRRERHRRTSGALAFGTGAVRRLERA